MPPVAATPKFVGATRAGGQIAANPADAPGSVPSIAEVSRKGAVVARTRKMTGALFGCMAILVGIGAWAPTALAAGPRSAPAIPPGVYSGTVRMSGVNNCVTTRCLLTLTGTWSVTVNAADQLRGSETLADTIPFQPGSGCTISPGSWTLTFNAVLGRYNPANQETSAAPGFVHGSTVLLYVNSSYSKWTGWKGSPSDYTRTCGSLAGVSWPINQQYGWPAEDTGWSVGYTAQLLIALFETRAHPYTIAIKGGGYHPDTFEQTYTLTSSPTA